MAENSAGLNRVGRRWFPDLHAHSQASDGALTPSELVYLAKERGLNLLALTDHDSLRGIDEACSAAAKADISLIPGIEISTEGDDEIHILGYFAAPGCAALDGLIAEIQADRISRGEKHLSALRALNLHLSMEEVHIPEGAMFSRPLLAQAMVRKGYAASVEDAFDRYLGVGRPAYVEKLAVKAKDAIRALRAAGAVPVLAHPGEIRDKEGLEKKVELWQASGLMGIEVYHPGNSAQERILWEAFARNRGMLVTGGSDFHRMQDKKHADLGQMLGDWKNASEDAEALFKLGQRS